MLKNGLRRWVVATREDLGDVSPTLAAVLAVYICFDAGVSMLRGITDECSTAV